MKHILSACILGFLTLINSGQARAAETSIINLSEGPFNPPSEQALGATDRFLTLHHFALSASPENAGPANLDSLELVLQGDGQIDFITIGVLTLDAQCSGDDGGQAYEVEAIEGSVHFENLGHSLNPGESLCYLFQIKIEGEICPCERYGSLLSPTNMGGHDDNGELHFVGEDLTASLQAPSATLDQITEIPVLLNTNETHELIVRLGDIRERCHADWLAHYEMCLAPAQASNYGLNGEQSMVEIAFDHGEFTEAYFHSGQTEGDYRVCIRPVLTPESNRLCLDLTEESTIFDIVVGGQAPTQSPEIGTPTARQTSSPTNPENTTSTHTLSPSNTVSPSTAPTQVPTSPTAFPSNSPTLAKTLEPTSSATPSTSHGLGTTAAGATQSEGESSAEGCACTNAPRQGMPGANFLLGILLLGSLRIRAGEPLAAQLPL